MPASLLDVPDTVADIMGWTANFGHTSLLTLEEGQTRTRHFRFYDWQDDAWESDYTGPIVEFAIDGSHYQVEWVIKEFYLPPES